MSPRCIAKNVKLCTVDDTDSFIYLINDVYEIIKCDISKFDTSNYAIDNAHGIPLADKKVPYLMKDKNNDVIMAEFVKLRAKMYALRGKEDIYHVMNSISKILKFQVTDLIRWKRKRKINFYLRKLMYFRAHWLQICY